MDKKILIGGGLIALALTFLLLRKKVKFRTTDLNYGPGSSVAFAGVCGKELTPLGYLGETDISGYICGEITGSQFPTFIAPCSWADDCRVYAWYADERGIQGVDICSNDGNKLIEYRIGQPYLIDTSPNSIDPSKEVFC